MAGSSKYIRHIHIGRVKGAEATIRLAVVAARWSSRTSAISRRLGVSEGRTFAHSPRRQDSLRRPPGRPGARPGNRPSSLRAEADGLAWRRAGSDQSKREKTPCVRPAARAWCRHRSRRHRRGGLEIVVRRLVALLDFAGLQGHKEPGEIPARWCLGQYLGFQFGAVLGAYQVESQSLHQLGPDVDWLQGEISSGSESQPIHSRLPRGSDSYQGPKLSKGGPGWRSTANPAIFMLYEAETMRQQRCVIV